ncbi:abortive infection protein [Streptomyces profundus]|uniref:abortive infection protein n=1 Tax=Streptomyces profundus TaxID=2867410 RepID=UPI001D16259B|nr:abortive infection protein [Streptomyces sp. MA3_2.13]UED83950.1 abortive infection protein [Streptomyces sp. MA3_2.13]
MAVLPVRGVCYDAGVRYAKDFHSRPHWHPDDVRRDMTAIRDDLSCNAVSIMATDPRRLIEAADIAAELGLHAWLQPRLIEARHGAIESVMRELGPAAERLSSRHGRVGINVGCELTLTSRGIVPGRSFDHRGERLPRLIGKRKHKFDRALNGLLDRLVTAVRESFGGPITYGAGDWESVDWSRFGYVGLDTYRDERNAAFYTDQVKRHVEAGKPVLITEFGSCAYRGAAERGGSGYDVFDHRTDPPSITADVIRDEQVQADYLTESIDALTSAAVHGTFVFAFSEPMLVHTDDPTTDADLASFGIVKITRPAGPGPDESEQWTPKAALHAVARRYETLAPDDAAPTPRPAG